MKRFSSGLIGQWLTGTTEWTLALTDEGMIFNGGAPIAYGDLQQVVVDEGVVWDTLAFGFAGGIWHRVEAIKADAIQIQRAVNAFAASHSDAARPKPQRRQEAPSGTLAGLLYRPLYLSAWEVDRWAREQSADGAQAGGAGTMPADLEAAVAQRNRQFVDDELERYAGFFDGVESAPLTLEQRRACVVMEDRNLLVASAGSGKTSVIVGKVGYAIDRGYARPEEILVLAFNNFAAAEIRDRIAARLGNLLEGAAVRVQTFHALGQSIGAAAGTRAVPAPAAVLDEGAIDGMMGDIIAALRKENAGFDSAWIELSALYLKPSPRPADLQSPHAWERHLLRSGTRQGGRRGYLTLNGEMVASQGELAIANWLFLHGVDYAYEKPVHYVSPDGRRCQYRPSFHLRELDAHVDHLMQDAHGRPAPVFSVKHRDSLAWQQSAGAELAVCLCTTSNEYASGQLLRRLAAWMQKGGHVVASRPGRQAQEALDAWIRTESSPFLTGLLRAFIRHAKSNRIGGTELIRRTGQCADPHRAALFARVADAIGARYAERLATRGEIDFDDMIIKAESAIRDGSHRHRFKLILVDEFQDISQGRARLLRAMLDARPGCKLFCVGDDWQSIYRFAGADVSLFKNFEASFGRAALLRLDSTFRSCQGIADVASRYVDFDGNPFGKKVRAADPSVRGSVTVMQYPARDKAGAGLNYVLQRLHREAADAGAKRSVFILARYKRLLEQVPAPSNFSDWLDIESRTIHGAKGLQADCVIVLGLMEGGPHAFPSMQTDDPMLDLVMPHAEAEPYAEERRLMYVALTRARRRAILMSCEANPSMFVTELLHDPASRAALDIWKLNAASASAPATAANRKMRARDGTAGCPACGDGQLVQRSGKYGDFRGCSSYPDCRYTEKVRAA